MMWIGICERCESALLALKQDIRRILYRVLHKRKRTSSRCDQFDTPPIEDTPKGPPPAVESSPTDTQTKEVSSNAPSPTCTRRPPPPGPPDTEDFELV